MDTVVADALARAPVFQGLPPVLLPLLGPASRILEVGAGETLLETGFASSALYVVLEGHLDVVRPRSVATAEGLGSMRINELGPGACFGELSLVTRRPASATVRARTPVRVVQLPGEDLQALLDESDKLARIFYRNLLELVIERVREKDEELELLSTVL